MDQEDIELLAIQQSYLAISRTPAWQDLLMSLDADAKDAETALTNLAADATTREQRTLFAQWQQRIRLAGLIRAKVFDAERTVRETEQEYLNERSDRAAIDRDRSTRANW